MGAADLEEPIDASLERRREHRRMQPWADGHDLAHPGDTGRNRRHQQ